MKWKTVVIDPPWPISMAGRRKIPQHQRPSVLPYATMSFEEIKQLPICELCEVGAHVYLWATNKTLRAAFECFDTWGVDFHLMLVTVKASGIAPANGYVFGTEFCLLGFANRPMLSFKSMGMLNWWHDAPRRGRHSVKPQIFYDRVEQMSPGPFVELFARRPREGWSVWGDEVTSDFVMAERRIAPYRERLL